MEELPMIEVSDGSRDCINVAFDVPLAEVESLLRRNGWTNVRVRNAAYLDGELPILELERPILDEMVRFHIRLFRYRGAIVGNAHLDALTLEATPEAVRLHRPFHDVGRDLIVGLFIRGGYDVEFSSNRCDGDNVIAKIYKNGGSIRT
jgi:hypothetical protein